MCGELPTTSAIHGMNVTPQPVRCLLLAHVAHEQLQLVGLLPPYIFVRVRACHSKNSIFGLILLHKLRTEVQERCYVYAGPLHLRNWVK